MSPRVVTVRETDSVRTRLRVNDATHELSVDSRLEKMLGHESASPRTGSSLEAIPATTASARHETV